MATHEPERRKPAWLGSSFLARLWAGPSSILEPASRPKGQQEGWVVDYTCWQSYHATLAVAINDITIICLVDDIFIIADITFTTSIMTVVSIVVKTSVRLFLNSFLFLLTRQPPPVSAHHQALFGFTATLPPHPPPPALSDPKTRQKREAPADVLD